MTTYNSKSDDDTIQEVGIQLLPAEMKQTIASFLNVCDVRHFSRTCKTIYNDLSLSTLPPIQLLSIETWNGFDDDTQNTPIRGPLIPIFTTNKTLAVTLSLKYLSWGFGVNSFLYIIGHKKKRMVTAHSEADDDDDDTSEFSNGRCVWIRHLPKYQTGSIKVSFHPEQDETYYLWYYVGLDGIPYDDLLELEDVVPFEVDLAIADLQVFETYFGGDIYDSSTPTLTTTTSVGNSNHNDSSNKIVDIVGLKNRIYRLAVTLTAQSLLGQLAANNHRIEYDDPILFEYFKMKGIHINDASLKTLNQLSICLLQNTFYLDAIKSVAQYLIGEYVEHTDHHMKLCCDDIDDTELSFMNLVMRWKLFTFQYVELFEEDNYWIMNLSMLIYYEKNKRKWEKQIKKEEKFIFHQEDIAKTIIALMKLKKDIQRKGGSKQWSCSQRCRKIGWPIYI